MNNNFTGLQLKAGIGLQNGEGLSTPNIANAYSSFKSIQSVSNFSNIYYTANSFPGLSSANIIALQSIGANSFPHLFGQVPNEFSSQLGIGPLFDIAPARTKSWFGNSTTANVYVAAVNQAQTYAMHANDVISSAATSQWPNGVASTLSGGFTAIGGDDQTNFTKVANAIKQLGILLLFSDPTAGFSNAGCLRQIWLSGNNFIGNLQATVWNKQLVDPVSKISYTVNIDFINNIIANPVGKTVDDTFKIVALNPLDILLGEMLNTALTETSDLDAMVTFFGIGSIAASIQNWTDVTNITTMLGDAAPLVQAAIGATTLDTYTFIQSLLNISGITGLKSISDAGTTMLSIQLPDTDTLQTLSSNASPLSSNEYGNIQAMYGPGTGTYGNPTVDDIMGSTDYNTALTATVGGLQQLVSLPQYADIVGDTGAIGEVLHSGVFPVGGVTLSNGTTYTTMNDLSYFGTILVNQNAQTLASNAPQIMDVAAFQTYNYIACTHNNSILLNTPAFAAINTLAIQSGNVSDISTLKNLYGFLSGFLFQYVGVSQSFMIDNPPHPLLYLKTYGFPSSLMGFVGLLSTLSATALTVGSIVNEVGGLNNITNCIDKASVTGMALSSAMLEAQNIATLQSNGINSIVNYSPNPSVLPSSTKFGLNTIGGIGNN